MSVRQTRRSFLQTLAAAPIAAMAPWRPPGIAPESFTGIVGWDCGSGPSRSAWILRINPPVVVSIADVGILPRDYPFGELPGLGRVNYVLEPIRPIEPIAALAPSFKSDAIVNLTNLLGNYTVTLR